MPIDVNGQAPVSPDLFGKQAAVCLGAKGPLPTKPNKFKPKGGMKVVFEFSPDLHPDVVLQEWCTWPWDVEKFPPFVNEEKKLPTNEEVARFSLPLKKYDTNPNGSQSMYGALRMLGGIVDKPDGTFRTNWQAINGARCWVEVDPKSGYVNKVFVDPEILSKPRGTPAAPPPAAAPAPAQPARAPDNGVPPAVSRETVVFAQDLFKALKTVGVDAMLMKQLVAEHGAARLDLLSEPAAREVLMDIAKLAADTGHAEALLELTPGLLDDEGLASFWNALREPERPLFEDEGL